MSSSGLWKRVICYVVIDDAEECIACYFTVGQTLNVEEVCCARTLVTIYQTRRWRDPDDYRMNHLLLSSHYHRRKITNALLPGTWIGDRSGTPCSLPQKKRTYAVAQLVEALRYKPKGRGFNSHWGHWIFLWIHPAALWPLRSTQPLTEMSAKDISSRRGRAGGGWGVKGASAYGWQPYCLHVPAV